MVITLYDKVKFIKTRNSSQKDCNVQKHVTKLFCNPRVKWPNDLGWNTFLCWIFLYSPGVVILSGHVGTLSTTTWELQLTRDANGGGDFNVYTIWKEILSCNYSTIRCWQDFLISMAWLWMFLRLKTPRKVNNDNFSIHFLFQSDLARLQKIF